MSNCNICEEFKNGEGSSLMNINGLITPVDFKINGAASPYIKIINEIRIMIIGSNLDIGGPEMLKFDSFAGGLGGGLLFKCIQNGIEYNILGKEIKVLKDFYNHCSPEKIVFKKKITDAVDFLLIIIPINGTELCNNDYMYVRVRDNLSGLSELRVIGISYNINPRV